MSAIINEELYRIIIDICQFVQRLIDCYQQTRQPDTLDSLVYQVERLYRILLNFESCSNAVLEAVGTSLRLFHGLNESCSGYVPPLIDASMNGRPKIDIRQEQLEYLLGLGFSCPKISEVLGVSLSTIKRRMNEFGLSVTSLYSIITDQELDAIVSQIKIDFPNSGYRLMQGLLLHRGHRVTQARIRDSLQRVDPEGVAIRWSTTVQRRKYMVSSPLSLWHVDGNHKLIRCVLLCVHVI